MLKIKERNWQIIKILKNFNFSSWKKSYKDRNQITIFENPESFVWKIVEVYDNTYFVGNGIIENFSWNENTKQGTIEIVSFLEDMKNWFIEDENWNKIVYKNDDIANHIEWILNQYISNTTNPLLYIKSKELFNEQIAYTYKYLNYKQALDKILAYTQNGFLKIEKDWWVVIGKTKPEIKLTYQKDILNISYKKTYDTIYNYIIFDNKNSENHIYIEREFTDSINKYWKRVKYISDSRVKDTDTANRIIDNIARTEPLLYIDSLSVNKEVDIYSKLKIRNLDKNLSLENIVVNVEYQKWWTWILYLDNEVNTKKYFEKVNDSFEEKENYTDVKVENTKTEISNDPALKNPDYIEETYINSVEIKSPTISGNNWYFSNIFKVWSGGIIIDWPNKEIRSSNYNWNNKTWFHFKDDGKFLLGKDTSNYFWYDGTNFEFKWKLIAWANSSIDFDYISWSNKPENKSTVWADWNSNLSNIPDSAVASYITKTKITSTQIESPTIIWNSGLFSGTVKVWSDGIIIDWPNKLIKSSNFSSGSAGWQIKNDGSAEFNNILARWTIQTATSGKRVRIGSDNNRVQIFNSSWTEIANFGYNTNSYNNILRSKVWSDGFSWPLLFLESSRNTNTARFIGHNNSSYPVVSIEASSTSDKWLYVKWQFVLEWNLYLTYNNTYFENNNWDLSWVWWKIYTSWNIEAWTNLVAAWWCYTAEDDWVYFGDYNLYVSWWKLKYYDGSDTYTVNMTKD